MAIAKELRVPCSGFFALLMKDFVNRRKLKDLFVSLREQQGGGGLQILAIMTKREMEKRKRGNPAFWGET